MGKRKHEERLHHSQNRLTSFGFLTKTAEQTRLKTFGFSTRSSESASAVARPASYTYGFANLEAPTRASGRARRGTRHNPVDVDEEADMDEEDGVVHEALGDDVTERRSHDWDALLRTSPVEATQSGSARARDGAEAGYASDSTELLYTDAPHVHSVAPIRSATTSTAASARNIPRSNEHATRNEWSAALLEARLGAHETHTSSSNPDRSGIDRRPRAQHFTRFAPYLTNVASGRARRN